MCMEGMNSFSITDDAFQKLVSNPELDLVHKQVLMSLYSMAAIKCLHEYKELLPVYLSSDWSHCETILETLERAGLLSLTEHGIELTHKVDEKSVGASCGCCSS
jgi:hypothetical protein